MPQVAQDLLHKILVTKQEDRLGFGSIADLKRHEFFQNVDFKSLSDMPVPMDLKLTKD